MTRLIWARMRLSNAISSTIWPRISSSSGCCSSPSRTPWRCRTRVCPREAFPRSPYLPSSSSRELDEAGSHGDGDVVRVRDWLIKLQPKLRSTFEFVLPIAVPNHSSLSCLCSRSTAPVVLQLCRFFSLAPRSLGLVSERYVSQWLRYPHSPAIHGDAERWHAVDLIP